MEMAGNVDRIASPPDHGCVSERPLRRSERVLLTLSAAAAVGIFYALCLVSLVWTTVLAILDLVALIAAMLCFPLFLFFGKRLLSAFTALERLLCSLLGSLRIDSAPEYCMPLRGKDAPGLYRMLEEMARRIGVQTPDAVVLEMSSYAKALLNGCLRGRGSWVLYIGYDALVILTEDELRSAIAHEMAHARLVCRGFERRLVMAAIRASRLALALDQVKADTWQSGVRLRTLELVSSASDHLAARVGALVAAYRRQDEFEADRAAAEHCGSDACRRALVKMRIASYRGRDLTWRDRLIHTQLEEPLSEWLRSVLLPPEGVVSSHMEEGIIAAGECRDFDFHPSLADRLAALPDVLGIDHSNAPAAGLLADADRVGRDFVAAMEHTAARTEQRETRSVLKWTMRRAGWHRFSAPEAAGLCLAGLGGALAVHHPASPAGAWVAAVGLALLAGAWITSRASCAKEMFLPVPDPRDYDQSLNSSLRATDVQAWCAEIEADMLKGAPELTDRGSRAAYWAGEACRALERCDYQRAWVASRLCLGADPKCLKGLLAHGVSCTYFGLGREAAQSLDVVFAGRNLAGSLTWGLGWATSLLGNWSYAEGYLLLAVSERPKEPTLWWMLGFCQWQRRKVHEAVESLRKAAELNPASLRPRLTLTKMLLESGRVREAACEYMVLEGLAPLEFDVVLCGVHASVLLGRLAQGERRAEFLACIYPGGQTYAKLAELYHGELHLEDQAYRCCEKACGCGFYPEALVRMSLIEHYRGEPDLARAHLLEALDLTREPAEGAAHPLKLVQAVCQMLIELNRPARACSAWRVHVDCLDGAVDGETLSLLVCAPTLDEAMEHALCLCRAMRPNQDPARTLVVWEDAEPEVQPRGPVVPGIYAWRMGPGANQSEVETQAA